jgi:hypothetical protein
MSKESAWQHQPDTDDTDWQEICDRNCIPTAAYLKRPSIVRQIVEYVLGIGTLIFFAWVGLQAFMGS